ncbi:MAG: DUF4020 domain-containing protein [Synechococcus sp. SB0677_bin_5]|nr:DUF4020 domain-containing protein [Synechococcus sp. SB0677_bin_5]
MGAPARLPSFRKLAEKVAEGTGKSITASETDDQFLGRLKEDGVRVHQRATETLQPDNLKPNALHRNLLRLFQEKDDPVRVVTTNFDCLFERAAEVEDLFKNKPKVFEAPALPPGIRFKGIVRLHGSVKEPEEMVLTHRDFGRAYLTEEDGWARRFLVSLFANHTVLFVGYSHNDTIMTYLTPSLPPDGGEKRFALVGSTSNDLDRWRRMGIEPIVFPQENKDDFTGLDRGVEGLADFRRRGVIGWQQEIAGIAKGEPPMIDGEDSHTIDHALTSVELTRFFVRAATSPKWIGWLDDRGYLKRLFAEGELEEQDRILCEWLAVRFARTHSDELFSVICRRYGKLNRHLWRSFVFQLDYVKDNSLDPHTLSQWVHILMNCIPVSTDEYSPSNSVRDGYEYYLWRLAEHCIKANVLQSFLQVYDAITARLVWFLPDYKHRDDLWNWHMKKLWEESLQPNLPKIVYTLLERATMRLEQRHSASVAWSYQNNSRMDDDSFHRSAIESHEQDGNPRRIDPIIDTVRDCFEWLVINDLVTVRNWCNRFISSDPPLLRRLAIHATNARQDLSADDKVAWLLEHCDVNEYEGKHEIFRMAADVYPQAGSQQRKALIQAISQYQAPVEIPGDGAARSAYHQFNWFQWLHNADPKCSLLKAELDKIRSQYPEFQPREHPDLNYWRREASRCMGPWTVEDLLARPASECLSNLLDYHPNTPELAEKDRMSMLVTVCGAVEQDPSWGLDLADAMAEKSAWESDLWTWVVSVWKSEKTDLDKACTRRVLSHLSTSKLHQPRNAGVIVDVLNRLIRNADTADLKEWLDTLHKIAIAIHPHAAAFEDKPIENLRDRDWFQKAINHPSGKLAEFWLHSIDKWYNQQDEPPQALNLGYRRALNTIIEDNGIPGKLGRTILASQFRFLHQVDSDWTKNHLLPLFDTKDEEEFSCAWDGYLTGGRLSLLAGELLKEKCIGGLQRAIQDFPKNRLTRFIQFYILVISYLVNNDKDKWIYTFFNQTQEKPELKHMFTTEVGRLLRRLDESSQNEWWNVWLRDYWNNRLQGIPCPLDDAEIATMFEWAIHLQGVFPEAVDMALQMGPVPLELPLYLQLSHNIGKINLINRYPVELAQLLIHLGKCQTSPWFWYQDSQILHQLLEKDLPEDLKQELQETILRIKIS